MARGFLSYSRPPLGFRQFHSIDLAGWQGRGKVPHLDEILAAIERQSTNPGMPAPREPNAARRRRDGMTLNTWAIIGVAIGMFFVIVGLLVGRPWDRTHSDAPAAATEAAEPNH